MLYLLSIFVLLGSFILNKFQKTAVACASVMLATITSYPNSATADPDFAAYATLYKAQPESVGGEYAEYGYRLLSYPFQHLVVDYQVFRWVYFILGFALLAWAISRFTTKIALPFFLYVVASFPIEAMQIRSFFAGTLVILAFSFLQERGWKNIAIAVLLVMLGAQIHISVLLFIPFIFATMIRPEKLIKVSAITFGVGAFAMLFRGQVYALVGSLMGLLPFRQDLRDRLLHSYNLGTSWDTTLFSVIVVLAMLAVYFYYAHPSIPRGKTYVLSVMILFSPLAVLLLQFDPNYCRIFRVFVMFFFIWAGVQIGKIKDPRKKTVFFFVVLGVAVLNVAFQSYIWHMLNLLPYVFEN